MNFDSPNCDDNIKIINMLDPKYIIINGTENNSKDNFISLNVSINKLYLHKDQLINLQNIYTGYYNATINKENHFNNIRFIQVKKGQLKVCNSDDINHNLIESKIRVLKEGSYSETYATNIVCCKNDKLLNILDVSEFLVDENFKILGSNEIQLNDDIYLAKNNELKEICIKSSFNSSYYLLRKRLLNKN